jgi:hypothetical protein
MDLGGMARRVSPPNMTSAVASAVGSMVITTAASLTASAAFS